MENVKKDLECLGLHEIDPYGGIPSFHQPPEKGGNGCKMFVVVWAHILRNIII